MYPWSFEKQPSAREITAYLDAEDAWSRATGCEACNSYEHAEFKARLLELISDTDDVHDLGPVSGFAARALVRIDSSGKSWLWDAAATLQQMIAAGDWERDAAKRAIREVRKIDDVRRYVEWCWDVRPDDFRDRYGRVEAVIWAWYETRWDEKNWERDIELVNAMHACGDDSSNRWLYLRLAEEFGWIPFAGWAPWRVQDQLNRDVIIDTFQKFQLDFKGELPSWLHPEREREADPAWSSDGLFVELHDPDPLRAYFACEEVRGEHTTEEEIVQQLIYLLKDKRDVGYRDNRQLCLAALRALMRTTSQETWEAPAMRAWGAHSRRWDTFTSWAMYKLLREEVLPARLFEECRPIVIDTKKSPEDRIKQLETLIPELFEDVAIIELLFEAGPDDALRLEVYETLKSNHEYYGGLREERPEYEWRFRACEQLMRDAPPGLRAGDPQKYRRW